MRCGMHRDTVEVLLPVVVQLQAFKAKVGTKAFEHPTTSAVARAAHQHKLAPEGSCNIPERIDQMGEQSVVTSGPRPPPVALGGATTTTAAASAVEDVPPVRY